MINQERLRRMILAPMVVAAVSMACADDEVLLEGNDGIADPAGMEAGEGGEGGESTCGNGQTEADEACDDGNQTDDDACSNACTLPVCGDGVVQHGEVCDDGNNTPDDGCTISCNLPGNGIAEHVSREFSFGVAVVVDSADQITILGHDESKSWIAEFDDRFATRWSKQFLKDDTRGLAIGTNDEVLLGGSVDDHARTRRLDPIDGTEIWRNGVEHQLSVFTAVAIAEGHMVSAGFFGAMFHEQGLLVRHDGDTGAPLSTIEWNKGPFGPVAVDPLGWIWVIDIDKDATLHVYNPKDELEHTVGLAAGIYEDIAVDDQRNVYVLARSMGKQSFTLWKYKEDGSMAWPAQKHVEASASSLALSPGGMVIVAGHTSDESNGLLVWYDQTDGALIDQVSIGTDGDHGAYEVFNDIAVAQSGAFAVAVGARGLEPNDTALWIYKFEL